MILIIAPAIDGLKKEWNEAAATLGATNCAVLALCRPAGAVAEPARHAVAAVRQRLRRHRHRLCADRLVAQHRADPALRADPRRRAAQPRPRRGAGARHDRHHRRSPTSSTWSSAPAPNGGSNEARQVLGLGHLRARRALFPRAADRDLRLLAAHPPRRAAASTPTPTSSRRRPSSRPSATRWSSASRPSSSAC